MSHLQTMGCPVILVENYLANKMSVDHNMQKEYQKLINKKKQAEGNHIQKWGWQLKGMELLLHRQELFKDFHPQYGECGWVNNGC